MSRLDRENFLDLVEVDGIQERDLLSTKFQSFKIKRPCTFYTLREVDVQRPDLLALKLYGKMEMWWILLKVNGIDSCWGEEFGGDMIVGSVIKVPNMLDIEDWTLQA